MPLRCGSSTTRGCAVSRQNARLRFRRMQVPTVSPGKLKPNSRNIGLYSVCSSRSMIRALSSASSRIGTLRANSNAPATSNDPALLERLRPSLERAAGKGNVVEVPRYTIAEDFSQFANVVPGLYFFVGTTPQGQPLDAAPMNHSPLYAPDENALDLGVRALLQATVDFLAQGT